MPAVLLVDSNSYFRLARHVPSLLGDYTDYQLRMLEGVDHEFRSRRLRTKFTWPYEPPHPEERQKWKLSVTPAQAKKVKVSAPIVKEFAEAALANKLPGRRKLGNDGAYLPFLSPVDLRLLCHAIECGCGVLTDERPLTVACKSHDVPAVSSLQMLRYLVGQKVVTMANVEAIVQYWQYDQDVPHREWAREYERRFKKAPPEPLL